MPADMKARIAAAAARLVFEKNVKKLTVTDIVAECQITRPTFYYHFEDIPALLRWILETDGAMLLKQTLEQETPEQGLCYLLRMAIHAAPYIKKGIQTNYGEEIRTLLAQFCYDFFERVVERNNLYGDYPVRDQKLFLRYHTCAVVGMLQEWTDEDTQHLEEIVHKMILIMNGDIRPRSIEATK